MKTCSLCGWEMEDNTEHSCFKCGHECWATCECRKEESENEEEKENVSN